MFCLGGFVRGVFGKGGFCPGGFCPGVYVRGVFVRGVFVLEPLRGGVPLPSVRSLLEDVLQRNFAHQSSDDFIGNDFIMQRPLSFSRKYTEKEKYIYLHC